MSEVAKRAPGGGAKEITALFEGERILFRNFAGEVRGPYDVAGQHKFSLALSPEQAAAMEADGWNVKYLRAREDDDVPQAHLPIKIKYGVVGRPDPKVVLVTRRDGEPIAQTELPEDLLMVADFAEIDYCDLLIRAYDWSVNGKSGRSAQLKNIYINMSEDELTRKYSDVPKEIYGTGQLEIEAGQDPDLGELYAEVVD